MILTRLAANISSTALDAYINKGVTNLVRILNVALIIIVLGLLAYFLKVLGQGYRQFPQDLKNRSILHSLSLHVRNPFLIIAAVICGFALSTRIVAIFAAGIVILYLLWAYRLKSILPLVIYTLITALIAYLSWPIFWQHGFSAIFKAVALFSDFDPYTGAVYFDGEIFKAYEIPWNYFPQLLSLQYTEILVVLSILGLILWIILLSVDRDWTKLKTKLMLVFVWFTLPFLYVVITTPIMYNNFRQFIFITPPLFVFAAYAIQFIHERFPNRIILPLILCLALIPGILNLFSLHPYQYIYYNQFAGGVRGASKDYELDYWFISMKEAMEYANAIAPQNAQVLVWDVEYPQAILYNRPDISISRVAHITEAEYTSYHFALIPKPGNFNQQIPEDWEPIHKISRNGADLVIVYEINKQ
jgi:hypothetical protein